MGKQALKMKGSLFGGSFETSLSQGGLDSVLSNAACDFFLVASGIAVVTIAMVPAGPHYKSKKQST